jgi:hypothetical protein
MCEIWGSLGGDFGDVKLCSLVEVNGSFGGTFYAHIQTRLLAVCYLVVSLLDPDFDTEDVSSPFFRKIC